MALAEGTDATDLAGELPPATAWDGFSAAFNAAATEKKEKVFIGVFDEKYELLWEDKMAGSQAFFSKIAASKARSMEEGKTPFSRTEESVLPDVLPHASVVLQVL